MYGCLIKLRGNMAISGFCPIISKKLSLNKDNSSQCYKLGNGRHNRALGSIGQPSNAVSKRPLVQLVNLRMQFRILQYAEAYVHFHS